MKLAATTLPSAKARNVLARSFAETPMVMPRTQSVETVNAMRRGSEFYATIMGSSSSLRRSSSAGAQIIPLICLTSASVALSIMFIYPEKWSSIVYY